jgi:hypothetical protein
LTAQERFSAEWFIRIGSGLMDGKPCAGLQLLDIAARPFVELLNRFSTHGFGAGTHALLGIALDWAMAAQIAPSAAHRSNVS